LSHGYLDVATCDVVVGWAWDPSLPTTAINVQILADGQVIATIPASTFRQDLLNAGIGNGQHAFFFNVPASLKNGQPRSIAARVAGPNIQLFHSPRSITCSPP
jgi:hypothetical protein